MPSIQYVLSELTFRKRKLITIERRKYRSWEKNEFDYHTGR